MSPPANTQFNLPEPTRSLPFNYSTLLNCFESYAKTRENEIIRLQSIVESHEGQARNFTAFCNGLQEQIRQLVLCRDKQQEQARQLAACRDKLQEELEHVVTCHHTQSRLVGAQQDLINALQSEVEQYAEGSHIQPRALQINPILLSQAPTYHSPHPTGSTTEAVSGVLLSASSDAFSANILLSMSESNPSDAPSTGEAQQPRDDSPNASCRRLSDKAETSTVDYR
ncbi:hypothetical protein ACHAO7_011145 [Fusarium culmorum]